MKIDRHNYEEFFILYWDNELSSQQKKLVDDFVLENPDLHDEFRLYGETRFTPEKDILFEEKESLLAKNLINSINYSGYLLSYIDDELTNDQKKLVEKFVSEHPAAAQELAILQKTKLQPEAEIAFPDKSLLYRREEKVSIIRITWQRVAVAAAIILLAGLGIFRVFNSNKQIGKPEIAKATDKPVQKPAEKEISNNAVDKNLVASDNSLTNKDSGNKKTTILSKENKVAENYVSTAKKGNKNNLPKEKGSVDNPLIAKNDFTKEQDHETTTPETRKSDKDALAINESGKPNDIFSNNSVTERNTPSLNNQNTTGAEFANYKEDAPSDKGGLKGFLRKATRVFEHRTKIQTTTDDNKLLLGAFAVSLK